MPGPLGSGDRLENVTSIERFIIHQLGDGHQLVGSY
jgi:hypothetical protein